MIFGDAALEEVLLLLDVHHLGEPGQRVFDPAGQRSEADAFKATVQPLLTEKRPGHARCITCHSTGTAFRLPNIEPIWRCTVVGSSTPMSFPTIPF